MKIEFDFHGEKSPLSKAENKILLLSANGLSRVEIAEYLHRTLSTINTHFNHIFQKLDADSRTNAVLIGLMKGILSFKHLMVIWMIACSINGAISSHAMAGLAFDTGYKSDDVDRHAIERFFRVRGNGRSGGRVRQFRSGRAGRKEGGYVVPWWFLDGASDGLGDGDTGLWWLVDEE